MKNLVIFSAVFMVLCGGRNAMAGMNGPTQFRSAYDPVNCLELGAIPTGTDESYDYGIAAAFNACAISGQDLSVIGESSSVGGSLTLCDGNYAIFQWENSEFPIQYYPFITTNGGNTYKTAYPASTYVGRFVLPYLNGMTIQATGGGAVITVDYNGESYSGVCDNTVGGG